MWVLAASNSGDALPLSLYPTKIFVSISMPVNNLVIEAITLILSYRLQIKIIAAQSINRGAVTLGLTTKAMLSDGSFTLIPESLLPSCIPKSTTTTPPSICRCWSHVRFKQSVTWELHSSI